MSDVISKSKFDKLVTRIGPETRKSDEARSAIGGMVAAAVENDNLHKAAFATFRRLKRMDDAKRSEFLFHFDRYRDYGDFDRDDLLEDRKLADAGDGTPQGSTPKPEHTEDLAGAMDDAIKKDAAAPLKRGEFKSALKAVAGTDLTKPESAKTH